jgi:hypothetical protein
MRGRLAELLEREALPLKRPQQLEPGLAVLGTLEEPLGLEVDSHADMVTQGIGSRVR